MVRFNRQPTLSPEAIEKLRQDVWQALNRAEDVDDIRTALDRQGFDQSRRAEVRTALTEIETNLAEMEAKRQEKRAANLTLVAARKKLNETFVHHHDLLREFLKDEAQLLRQLDLDRPHRTRLMVWMNQVEDFYWMLRDDPKLAAVTAHFKMDAELLNDMLKQVENLRELEHQHKLALIWVNGCVWRLDQSINGLERPFADFRLAAREALREQPHYLIALGLDPTP